MTNSEARKRQQVQNPAESAPSIDGSPGTATDAPGTLNGPQAANLGDGANGQLSEAERAALRLQVRQALVTSWRDDYSVGTVVSGVAECIEDYLAAIVREHTERAWDEGFDRGFYDPLAGHGATGHDASESLARNPYAARQEQNRG